MATTTSTGASADMIELLTSQHREVAKRWSQLQSSHGEGGDAQQQQAREIIKLLSQHDAIETQMLYPELRKCAADAGAQKSQHSLEEHQRVRELLKDIDGEDISDESAFATMEECLSTVSHHVQEEENEIFPLLRSHVDGPRLIELGRMMTEMMDKAPTHPHPMTPDSKAGATAAGAVTGVMDKARDAVRGES